MVKCKKQERTSQMNKNYKRYTLLLLLFIPILFYVINKKRVEIISPEQALQIAKDAFNHVETSYIVHTPQKVTRLSHESLVYKGGISNATHEYEFTIDAYTGDMIGTREIN